LRANMREAKKKKKEAKGKNFLKKQSARVSTKQGNHLYLSHPGYKTKEVRKLAKKGRVNGKTQREWKTTC